MFEMNYLIKSHILTHSIWIWQHCNQEKNGMKLPTVKVKAQCEPWITAQQIVKFYFLKFA